VALCLSLGVCQIEEISQQELVSASAYILFYIRRDMQNVRFEDVYPVLGRSPAGTYAGSPLDDSSAELLLRRKASPGALLDLWLTLSGWFGLHVDLDAFYLGRTSGTLDG
jgi:hypothetical protein